MKKTPTPFDRMSLTVCVDRLDERIRRVVEEEVRFVEEEHELRLVEVADLRQRLEELGQEPHECGGEQLRLVPDGGELEARDDSRVRLMRCAGGR